MTSTSPQAAADGFARLIDLWDNGDVFSKGSGGGCFWMAANTFHSAVDYLKVTGTKDG